MVLPIPYSPNKANTSAEWLFLAQLSKVCTTGSPLCDDSGSACALLSKSTGLASFSASAFLSMPSKSFRFALTVLSIGLVACWDCVSAELLYNGPL